MLLNISIKMKKLNELFDINYGASLELINCNIVPPKDGIPFVSRTSKNNGVVAFVEPMENILPNPGGTLSVAVGGSVLSTFLQETEYYSGFHILYLKPRFKLTKLQLLFYCYSINFNAYKYSYGRQANKTLKDLLVPDVAEIPKEFLKLNIKKPKNDKIKDRILNLDFNQWQTFHISELFELQKCKCNNATELLTSGDDIYYIGAKKKENGVMKKVVRDEQLVTKGNCILFIGDGQGSIGYSLYQQNDFIGSSTLTAGYNDYLNKYNALFIVTILDLERYRYSFGRKYGKDQILKATIKLPTIDNKPNWKYMEEFIKALPYSKAI